MVLLLQERERRAEVNEEKASVQYNGEAKMERGVMRVVRGRDGGEISEEGLLKRCTCTHTHAHTNTSQVLGNKHALKTIENTHSGVSVRTFTCTSLF